ncbi:hypothetical protein [Paraburkholderia adhaesiva]|uniref:hypothetical protein n=1 Tax=Paraburkholderia adhaesiva TaxID=2883244 RepID=UPI001F460522|nr:hypothetical protein [Paraburkholderia adhaesiva]
MRGTNAALVRIRKNVPEKASWIDSIDVQGGKNLPKKFDKKRLSPLDTFGDIFVPCGMNFYRALLGLILMRLHGADV